VDNNLFNELDANLREAVKVVKSMNWTTSSPTEPGWYLWKKTTRSLQENWEAFYFEQYKQGVRWSGIGTAYIAPHGGWWFGPIIPEPKA